MSIDKVKRTRGTILPSKIQKKSANDSSKQSKPKPDSIEISEEARNIQGANLNQRLDEIDDIRVEVVQRVKKNLDQGKYDHREVTESTAEKILKKKDS